MTLFTNIRQSVLTLVGESFTTNEFGIFNTVFSTINILYSCQKHDMQLINVLFLLHLFYKSFPDIVYKIGPLVSMVG